MNEEPTHGYNPGPTVGLSGLFPGPVIASGRRFWDWNPNSRDAAIQRWYSGLDRDDWVLIDVMQGQRLDPWPMFRPPFCTCPPGGKCPGPGRGECYLCRLAIEDCARDCSEDRGHDRACKHWRATPNRWQTRRAAALERRAKPRGKDRNRATAARVLTQSRIQPLAETGRTPLVPAPGSKIVFPEDIDEPEAGYRALPR